MNGIVYIAYGRRARNETLASIKSLRQFSRLPVTVICEEALDGASCIFFDRPGPGARWAKLNIDRLVDYDNIAYFDADTRIRGNVARAFDMLDGWDMLVTPSLHQGGGCLHHVGKNERGKTFAEIGNPYPLQLQAGVMFFNRQRCARLFAAWRDEWLRWKDKDQAALLRALRREPIRIMLLGRPWNGGEVVEHLFGRARMG